MARVRPRRYCTAHEFPIDRAERAVRPRSEAGAAAVEAREEAPGVRRAFYIGLAVILGAVYVQLVLEGPQVDVEGPRVDVRRTAGAGGGRPAGDAAGSAAPATDLPPDPEAERALSRWEADWEPGLEPGREPEADSLIADAARAAWAYLKRNYSPETGLVRAHDEYRYVTIWDVASALAGYWAAARLGLADTVDYRVRTTRALATLGDISLFEGRLFNKVYDAETGEAVDAATEPSIHGYGWSAIDLGRLLLWLRILRADAELAPLVDSVVARIDIAAAMNDGLLQGRERSGAAGARSYQEGRLGYEQYAARGFALWGADVGAASDFFAHAVIDSAYGRPIPRDIRGTDCLTSEPLVLAGMEFGWDPAWGEVARAALEAQHARFLATDTVTVASEDASSEAPHYFYYYCIGADGEAFAVRAKGEGELLDGPRAVSTKAALAWYALAPSRYTARAVRTVAAGVDTSGAWPAGVLEGSGVPSGGENVNTAGVILEAAVYARDGAPFLAEATPGGPGIVPSDAPDTR